MTQKRLTALFLLCFLVLLSVLPITNMVKDKFNPIELKPFNMVEIANKLFSKDHLEGWVNSLLKKVGISGDYPNVIIGKNDYYFLGGSFSGLNNCRGYRFNKVGIDQTVNELSKQQSLLNELGIKSFAMVVPDRFRIYPEMLPQWVHCTENEPIDYFLGEAEKKLLSAIYPRDALLDREIPTYFRTDSHWTHYGAYIGYQQLLDAINKKYPDEFLVRKEITKFEEGPVRNGDLVKFLKYMVDKPDYEFTLKPEWKFSGILKCEYDEKKQLRSECVKYSANPGTIVNEKSFSTMNEYAWNNKKLLFIGDSFGEGNSQLLQQTFRETIQVHYSRVSDTVFRNILATDRPDYVIYQIVERDLDFAMMAAAQN
jgi:alginate O-acetyltransferase complex protein AlgJ